MLNIKLLLNVILSTLSFLIKSSIHILKSIVYINYLQTKSFIVNSGNTNLLKNIINENHMQVILMQEELPLKNLFILLMKVIDGTIII